MQYLNEHQKRLWKSMLKSIEDFRNGNIAYCNMVGELEGALDASDINNKEVSERWYDYWIPLEIERATKGNCVESADVEIFINNLEKFINDTTGLK